MSAELFLLSAKTPETLRALCRRWIDLLAQHPDVVLSQLAASAAREQLHQRCRTAIVTPDKESLLKSLAAIAPVFSTRPPRIAFVFSGGGSQWPGMGRRLFQEQPVFRDALAECDARIRHELGWSVIDQINLDRDHTRLEQVEVFHAAIFSMQVALAALWRSWGVRPSIVVGHSMGEIAAAHVAGSLSFEDATRIITRRGRIQGSHPGKGTAAVIGLSFADAESAIGDRAAHVSVAATNGPRMTVLSGATAPLEAILAELGARGVFCRFIKGATVAPHSPEMDPLIEPLRAELKEIKPRAGTIPIFSTVDLNESDGARFDADYWARNLRQPVRFAEAIAALAPRIDRFLEISAHPVLLPAIDENLAEGGRTLPSLKRDTNERETLLATIGALYCAGAELDFKALFPGEIRGGPEAPILERPAAVAIVPDPEPPPAPKAPLSPVHEALLALEEMQAELDRVRASAREPIAVISMACRYPGGADTPEKLWELLERGADCVSEIPRDRFDADIWFDPAGGPGKMMTRSAGFLETSLMESFDPLFFGISPREAMVMDPQQRLLLEVAHEAMERAGQAPDRLAGTRTGVFAGICSNDYYHGLSQHAATFDGYSMIGNVHSFAVGRISYLFDLLGPSLVVDTACSSSLVAIHLACKSLRSSECDLALAGGVNLILSPSSMVFTSVMNALAPDGRAKAFDASADGTNRGEGCGVVVLKRLSDAQAAGDPILAVIRGSALNHDGKSNGMTAPSVHAQEAVIRAALEDAGVAAGEVEQVEAHGTGTRLGDPIEVEALKATYGAPRADGRHCFISALKTNIGHTEAAAGVGGLIKMVLSLQSGAIPAVVHFRELNPHIDLRDTCLSIPKQLEAWPKVGRRVAGISAFGASGTNAHLIVEEAEPSPIAAPVRSGPQILALSAKSAKALAVRIDELAAALEAEPEISLADVCFTSNVGRSHFTHRAAFVASSAPEALQKMKAARPAQAAKTPSVAFSFPAEILRFEAGETLREREPIVRETLARIEAMFVARGVSFASRSDVWSFALSTALAALWRSFGVEPSLIHGAGEGEIAALLAAGAISETQAVEYVVARLRSPPRGASAVPLVLGPDAPIDAERVITIRAEDPAEESLLLQLAQLYESGVAIDFAAVHRARPGRRVVLPTYPFEKKRLWAPVLDAPPDTGFRTPPPGLRGTRVEVAGTDQSFFERSLSAESPAYLGHHRLFEIAILPAAAHVELMLCNAAASSRGWTLEDVRFLEALSLPDAGARSVQVTFTPSGSGARRAQVFAAAGKGGEWTLHASGSIRAGAGIPSGEAPANVRARVNEPFDLEAWYTKLRGLGLEFGADFRAITSIAVKEGEAAGEIALAPHLSADAYVAHPALLDGCFQIAGPALATLGFGGSAYVPVRIERLSVSRPIGARAFCHAKVRPTSGDDLQVRIDLRIFDSSGVEVAQIWGLELLRLSSRTALGLGPSGLIDWLYRLDWEPRALDVVPSRSGPWLIFADRGGMAETVASRLGSCFVVNAGASWERSGARFTIRPSRSEDYTRLFQELRNEAGFKGILHFWSLDAPIADLSAPGLTRAEELGPRSILELMRALGHDSHAPLQLITRGAMASGGELSFSGAMLWGLARSLRAERPSLVRAIDLDPSLLDAEALFLELDRGDSEPEILLCGSDRKVSRLSRASRTSIAGAPYTWKNDATYLVLGGLGAVGFEMARWMIARGARRIVLAGRSAPGAALDAPLAQLQRSAEVVVAQVDLAAESSVRLLLSSLHDDRFPLRGVVHSAGLFEDAVITNQTPDSFSRVFAPKVGGSRNLHAVLEELELAAGLDFIAYFASGASTLGSAGQTNYAAANAFQDALASFESASGARSISINWGPWGEVGGAERRGLEELWARKGVGTIDPERGFSIFEHLIAGAPPQIAVLPIQWPRFAEHWPDARTTPIFSRLIGERSAASSTAGENISIVEALKTAAPEQRHPLIVRHVSNIIARVLCVDPSAIDTHAPLTNLGMDSLVALQVKHKIELDLGVAVPVVELLRGAPIEELCVHLDPARAAPPPAAAAPASGEINPDEAAQLLTQVDGLSDEEVRAQLERLLESEG